MTSTEKLFNEMKKYYLDSKKEHDLVVDAMKHLKNMSEEEQRKSKWASIYRNNLDDFNEDYSSYQTTFEILTDSLAKKYKNESKAKQEVLNYMKKVDKNFNKSKTKKSKGSKKPESGVQYRTVKLGNGRYRHIVIKDGKIINNGPIYKSRK